MLYIDGAGVFRTVTLVRRCSPNGGVKGQVVHFVFRQLRPHITALFQIGFGKAALAAALPVDLVTSHIQYHFGHGEMHINAVHLVFLGSIVLRILFRRLFFFFLILVFFRFIFTVIGFQLWRGRYQVVLILIRLIVVVIFRRIIFLLFLRLCRRLFVFLLRFRRFPHSVGQHVQGRFFHIFREDIVPFRQCSNGSGCFQQVQVRPVSGTEGLSAVLHRQFHHSFANLYLRQQFPGPGNLRHQLLCFFFVFFSERCRIF